MFCHCFCPSPPASLFFSLAHVQQAYGMSRCLKRSLFHSLRSDRHCGQESRQSSSPKHKLRHLRGTGLNTFFNIQGSHVSTDVLRVSSINELTQRVITAVMCSEIISQSRSMRSGFFSNVAFRCTCTQLATQCPVRFTEFQEADDFHSVD